MGLSHQRIQTLSRRANIALCLRHPQKSTDLQNPLQSPSAVDAGSNQFFPAIAAVRLDKAAGRYKLPRATRGRLPPTEVLGEIGFSALA